MTDKVLDLVLSSFGHHLCTDSNPLPRQETLLQILPFPRGNLKGELRRQVALLVSADSSPRKLERIKVRAGRVEGNHSNSTRVKTSVLMNAGDISFCYHDLALHILSGQILAPAEADPYQLRCDVPCCAPCGEHRSHIEVRGKLLAHGRNLPQLSFDSVPCLAAGESNDL